MRSFRSVEVVQQSKNARKRKTNRALNPKRSDFFVVKINCGTASVAYTTLEVRLDILQKNRIGEGSFETQVFRDRDCSTIKKRAKK